MCRTVVIPVDKTRRYPQAITAVSPRACAILGTADADIDSPLTSPNGRLSTIHSTYYHYYQISY